MRGFGFVGDLVMLGLIGLTMLGWMYLWYLCVFGAEKPIARIFGDYALAISAIGFPFLAYLVFAIALKVFGRQNIGWALAIFGVGLPVLGALYLRKEMNRGKR
ncbi:hypothetical protein IB254_02030 [Pseudomonas sp. PDM03]|uniref:hypothetical protein n=1 Tax=Pseudomonas sp. PDM03 TaxID=2769266 RepID=UPI0017853ED6|nr:hypothetical protein [Pseudomonas sp. PDM03]MBD9585824.1 hypothetical protein [Pseudomonas sp. PDM03]